uniref:Uncharacterized protein n=1 Tax=Kalanchoe fedtschenkoi TaxID=63787 RepID=A0A7N0TGG7_KALFE
MDLIQTQPPLKDTATTLLLPQFKGSSSPLNQNDHLITPKLRKPYTITKQREKWTDQEHHKFLDALKLYGRAWRLIEEFVGTKTAVQIRSHAQKFFSKVVRGGNDSNESPIEVIEIPPPRPKRKPTHPYPRKLVDSQNNLISPSYQPGKRICPHVLTTDSENQSPNSVISAATATPHKLELPVSDMPDSCLSTSSCSSDLQSGSFFSVDKEDGFKAINSTKYKGKHVLPTIKRSASSSVDNLANLENKSFEEEADLPEATIMLFGQVLYTKDSQRPSTGGKGTFNPSEQQLAKTGNKHGKLDESPALNNLDSQLSHGMYYENWRPWSWNEMNSDLRGGSSCQWMPLPLYGGLPPPYHISCSNAPTSSFVAERTDGKERYSFMVKNDFTEETKDTAEAVNNIASPKRSYKSGFVPYKRCSAPENINSAKAMTKEEDDQRVRLCL